MDQELRILHLDCSTGFGGQERDHLSEAKGFIKKGHTYILGVKKGTPLAREAGQATRIIGLSLRNNLDLGSLSSIRHLLLKERINVMVTTSYIDSWLGAVAALSLGKARPLLIRQRHILNPPRNLFPFRSLCDRLVVVSDALRIFFVEMGLPFWHVVTIPRGIETGQDTGDEGKVLEIRKNLKIPEGTRVLLQIGTFQRDKGHLLMLDALKFLWKKSPDIVMVFLGTGPMFDEVVESARRRFPDRIDSHLFFPGQQNPGPYIALSSLLVVPSLRESFSLVTLEAIGNGVPVVAYRVGGIPEIFNTAAAGKLVLPRNPSAFSEAILEMLNDKALQEKTRTVYSKKIQDQFSMEQCIKRTESLYRWGLDRLRAGKIRDNPFLELGGREDPFFKQVP